MRTEKTEGRFEQLAKERLAGLLSVSKELDRVSAAHAECSAAQSKAINILGGEVARLSRLVGELTEELARAKGAK